MEEGSRKKARTETQVESMMVETGNTPGSLPTASVAWIPVVEQVLETGVVDKSRNKSGKMKARARAKLRQVPADRAAVGSAAASAPATRKSQRARQAPAKFRYLVPRPLSQQALPPVAPAFIHPPSSNGLSALPLPRNLMLPFPPVPLAVPLGNNSLPPPAVTAPLHLSSFPRSIDPSFQPSSTSAVSPAHAVLGARLAPLECRPLSVASKRSASRRNLSTPFQTHASQRSTPSSQASSAETLAPFPGKHGSVREMASLRATLQASAHSRTVCATQVASRTRGSSIVHAPQACSCPCNSNNSPCPSAETKAANLAEGRYARKPPLPPSSWYRKSLPQNLPYPPLAILQRSFANIPPLPTRESYSLVPPRASLNNRQLGCPKTAGISSNPLYGKSQVVLGVSSPRSVPWLVPPQRDTRPSRTSVSYSSGQTDGDNVPGQTRSQQKRRMRQLKNGLGKKFQNFAEGAKLIEGPDGQHTGVHSLKQIVLTEEQRTKLVNDMIEACRADPKFRAKYIDAVRQLSYFGVLQTASYQLVAQGPNRAAQEVLDAWQPSPMQGGSASIDLYRAVNKVHEGVETMQKLPSLKEANSCSMGKRNDGAWIVTLPEDKRKLNGQVRPPANAS
ncbi:hypothetical protein R1flu_019932 [Riccia fluitans]|uniref:Uncharacterized protein n=1 Tax=Riccia fluitans TaxID=41844 RepID=A0ABD1ZNK0_9MARC